MTRWQYTFLQWRHEFFNICGKWINHLVRYTSQERKIGHLIKITYSSWNVKFPLSLDIQAKILITLHQLLLWRKSPAFFKKKKNSKKNILVFRFEWRYLYVKNFSNSLEWPKLNINFLFSNWRKICLAVLLIGNAKNWLHAICKI